MIRSALSKVAWVGRTASMVFGLALVLALVFGALSVAAAHTGAAGLFHLGHNNPVSAISTLTKSGAGPALSLKVDSGPPLAVNRTARVANLNADKLDGFDASAFDTSNTGKIHRIDTVTRLDGGEISLLTVGPFKFVGLCDSPPDRAPYIATRLEVAPEGKPYAGAVSVVSDSEGGKWGNASSDVHLMVSVNSNASGYATGYLYSPGNNPGTVEKGVTFHLYQNRNTHPTTGNLCTFGGYVVEDV